MFLLAWISNSLIQLVFACHQVLDFAALATIEYWLSVGFTFEVGREILKTLQGKYPGLLSEWEPSGIPALLIWVRAVLLKLWVDAPSMPARSNAFLKIEINAK
jgi:hypothetical protein